MFDKYIKEETIGEILSSKALFSILLLMNVGLMVWLHTPADSQNDVLLPLTVLFLGGLGFFLTNTLAFVIFLRNKLVNGVDSLPVCEYNCRGGIAVFLLYYCVNALAPVVSDGLTYVFLNCVTMLGSLCLLLFVGRCLFVLYYEFSSTRKRDEL